MSSRAGETGEKQNRTVEQEEGMGGKLLCPVEEALSAKRQLLWAQQLAETRQVRQVQQAQVTETRRGKRRSRRLWLHIECHGVRRVSQRSDP